MAHERSETVEVDGKYVNVYGRGTPKAGQQLPDSKAYDSLGEAVSAARERSRKFSEQHPPEQKK